MAINYKRTDWVDEVTPLDADNMNNIEKAIESLSSMAVSNISDGAGKGSVVQIGNAANGKSSAVFGVGNTASDKADGQFVAGRYSQTGQNGLSSDQKDEQLIVRIGAGTSASSPKTVFSIDNSGTTCMVKAAVKTAGIADPWNVINREYADNRYMKRGEYAESTRNQGAYIANRDSGQGIYVIANTNTPISFDSSTGLFSFDKYASKTNGADREPKVGDKIMLAWFEVSNLASPYTMGIKYMSSAYLVVNSINKIASPDASTVVSYNLTCTMHYATKS